MWLTEWAAMRGGSGFQVILSVIFIVGLLLKMTCRITFNIWCYSEWNLPSALYVQTLRAAVPSIKKKRQLSLLIPNSF